MCLSSDIKIINGRIGNDAGEGNLTFMSANGKSVIDYALCNHNLFPIIKDFIVHDFQTCSSHAPIQLCLTCSYEDESISPSNNRSVNYLKWNTDKINEFRDKITSNIQSINAITDEVISSSLDITDGVNGISDILYNISFTTYGHSRHTGHTSNINVKRKYKSSWFNEECECARKEFRKSNRRYKHTKNEENREIMLCHKKKYNSEKKKGNYPNKYFFQIIINTP